MTSIYLDDPKEARAFIMEAAALGELTEFAHDHGFVIKSLYINETQDGAETEISFVADKIKNDGDDV